MEYSERSSTRQLAHPFLGTEICSSRSGGRQREYIRTLTRPEAAATML